MMGNVAEAQVQAKRILILYEVGTAYPGVNQIEEGLRAAFDTSHDKLEIYREYLETVLFPDPTDQQRFREFYIRKYQDRRPDVIITVGPSPLKFMVETHKKTFSGVPIVFCLPTWVPGALTLDSDFAGAVNDLSPAATLETAVHLRPETKHIAVVGGTSYIDAQIEATVKEQLKPFESRFDISYLTNLAMPDLQARLRHLPDKTIVLLTSLSRDARGTTFIAGTEATSMIVAASKAPVFVLYETFLNHGEVGGKVFSHRKQGRFAGELALRILHGGKPQDIPRMNAGTFLEFDWLALKRWGIKEKNLPPGSIVLNRQPTVWELYRWYIICGIAVMALEALLIFGLLWQRARRKHAETRLAITYERLRLALDAGRFVGWDLDLKAGTNRWFGNLEGIFGIVAHNYLAPTDEFRRRVHPDDLAKVLNAIDYAKRNKEPYIAEFRFFQHNGNVRWVIARGQFYYAKDGEAERMLGVAVDITERKLAEEALASVGGRLIQAQEQERARIARELHDDINQRLAMLQIDLVRIRQHPPVSDTELQVRINELCGRLSEASIEVQGISHRLHSSKLEYLGLAAACKSFCVELGERQGIKIDFAAEDVPRALPEDVSLAVFRVLQEALQNATKYSGSQRFEVQLRANGKDVQLTVRDHGKGFDIEAALNGNGLGLISMRERVSLVRGTIAIRSERNSGTEIDLHVPFVVANQPMSERTSGVA